MTATFLRAGLVVLLGTSVMAEGGPQILAEGQWDELSDSDRSVNGLTARPIDHGSFLLVVTHRARQSLTEDAGRDFLGLDAGGLKIGLGLRWGALRNLDVGVFRLNGVAEVFDTVEFDLRYRVLSQERNGMDVAFRPGITWFIQPEQGDASGLFGQLLANRTIGKRFTVGAGILYHADSSSDRKALSDDDASVAVAVMAEVRLSPKIALSAELAPALAGYSEDRPACSVGVKAFTYGHTFSVVVSNTQYIGADGMVTGAWRKWDEPILGFTITRDIAP